MFKTIKAKRSNLRKFKSQEFTMKLIMYPHWYPFTKKIIQEKHLGLGLLIPRIFHHYANSFNKRKKGIAITRKPLFTIFICELFKRYCLKVIKNAVFDSMTFKNSTPFYCFLIK